MSPQHVSLVAAAVNLAPLLLVFVAVPLCALVAAWLGRRYTPPPTPPPPTGVYRVPTWAARTPAALRQHPDLAHVDQQLDRIATYYPTERRTP